MLPQQTERHLIIFSKLEKLNRFLHNRYINIKAHRVVLLCQTDTSNGKEIDAYLTRH